MCRSDFDETWDVWASWWGQGRCGDCGHVGRVLYEELGPERDEEYDEDLLALLLNDGVPELGAELDAIWKRSVSYLALHSEHYADPGEVLASLPPKVADVQQVCERCLEARRWLSEWCRTWTYGDYLSDICEHWWEDDLARHAPFARLVVLARRNWRSSHRRSETLVPVATVQRLVDESLAWLRRETGRLYAR